MEDEDDGVRSLWLKDPHTQSLARAAAQDSNEKQAQLYAACVGSTDPDVRGAYVAFQAAAFLMQNTFHSTVNPVRKTPPRGNDEQKESPKVAKPRQPHGRRARAAEKRGPEAEASGSTEG